MCDFQIFSLLACIICLGFPDSSFGKESACHAGDLGLIPGSGRCAGEGIVYWLQYSWASLVTQLVKNLPEMRETWVQTLSWKDPLEKGKATCREPPREIPPMTKVMRKRPDRQRQIRPRGTPWICSSIYPKTRICLSYYFVPFTNSSDINRGLSPTTFFWKKST